MRGVVTGGSGFLGSHVADVLEEAGHGVTVVDVSADRRHRSVQVDILSVESLVSAFRGAEFVCHLAAIGDVYLAAEQPALAAKVNVVGTANVCEASLVAGVPTIVYASTWEVYGRPRYEPIDEPHPCAPDHPYSITKLAGERIALAAGHLHDGLSVVALRLGTAYGPRMRSNSVFSIFIGRALEGKPITIQGTGEQARQFTHARDIGDAFSRALDRGKNGDVYNVVSDESITIKQLAEHVVGEIPTELEFAPSRKGDVPTARVSSELIKNELGWASRINFREGVDALIASYGARAGDKT